MTKTASVLCAAMLALTACGGGEPKEERLAADRSAEAKENIKASLLEQSGALAGAKVTDAQAGCISDGMVHEVGVDQLQEYDLLDEKLKVRTDATEQPTLAKGDAEALAAVFTDCVDTKQVFEDQVAAIGDGQLTDDQQECLKGAIGSDAIEGALAESFQGKETDPTQELQGELMACVAGGSSGSERMELPPEEK